MKQRGFSEVLLAMIQKEVVLVLVEEGLLAIILIFYTHLCGLNQGSDLSGLL